MQWFGNQQILKSLVVINEGDITWIKKYEEKKRRKLEHPKHIHLKWQCMHVYVQECARIHKLQANLKT